jgi:hypothetical protein
MIAMRRRSNSAAHCGSDATSTGMQLMRRHAGIEAGAHGVVLGGERLPTGR